MSSLLDLPNELILQIYRDLGDIDDVLHLARTCSHLNSLFESGNNRLGIFRRVIV